jgi:RNA polymerase sigma factor (sigma-70 family)
MRYNNELVAEMIRLCRPFNAEKNEELLPQVARGDGDARQQMIEGNMSFVINRVDSYIRRRPEIEFLRDDMTSQGLVGVCKAVNLIARGREVTNATACLSYWINREILRVIERETGGNNSEENGVVLSDNTVETISREDTGWRLIDLRDLIYSCCKTEQERQLIQLREQGKDTEAAASVLGVSRATAYRMLKRIERRYERCRP